MTSPPRADGGFNVVLLAPRSLAALSTSFGVLFEEDHQRCWELAETRISCIGMLMLTSIPFLAEKKSSCNILLRYKIL